MSVLVHGAIGDADEPIILDEDPEPIQPIHNGLKNIISEAIKLSDISGSTKGRNNTVAVEDVTGLMEDRNTVAF